MCISLMETVKKLVLLHQFCERNQRSPVKLAIIVFEADLDGVVKLSRSPTCTTRRTKHIDMSFHFVREGVDDDGTRRVFHVKSKNLSEETFRQHRSVLLSVEYGVRTIEALTLYFTRKPFSAYHILQEPLISMQHFHVLKAPTRTNMARNNRISNRRRLARFI